MKQCENKLVYILGEYWGKIGGGGRGGYLNQLALLKVTAVAGFSDWVTTRKATGLVIPCLIS